MVAITLEQAVMVMGVFSAVLAFVLLTLLQRQHAQRAELKELRRLMAQAIKNRRKIQETWERDICDVQRDVANMGESIAELSRGVEEVDEKVEKVGRSFVEYTRRRS